jgi:hypothetical protein
MLPENVPFALNDKRVQKFLLEYIESEKFEFVIFDNLMSLTQGDQKDTQIWTAVGPWSRKVSNLGCATLWIHHTGYETGRGYGDITKTWGADTVIHLSDPVSDGIKTGFQLTFQKARERGPENFEDFKTRRMTLENDQWRADIGQTLSPFGDAFLKELKDNPKIVGGRPALHQNQVKAIIKTLYPKQAADAARKMLYRLSKEYEVIDLYWYLPLMGAAE